AAQTHARAAKARAAGLLMASRCRTVKEGQTASDFSCLRGAPGCAGGQPRGLLREPRIGLNVVPQEAHMRALIGTALLELALMQWISARGEDYPSRPVPVVSPYAPGGGIDLLARLLAARLEQRLGRPFVVENKAGAATAIAATSVAHAAPDGYTIMLATSTIMAINVSMTKHLAYDPARALAPVALVTRSPFVLVVNPELPVHSIAELIAYAKAHPGELNYGSAGIGSFHHLSAEMLSRLAGIKMAHIPYKATPPALNDVVAGRGHPLFGGVPPALPLGAGGQRRRVGGLTAQRGASA